MSSTSPKVHIHTSPPDAFFVNSFIIEGKSSLILVDTQFVLSEARSVANRIAALEKPLAAILITHPHPDHYNGIASILEKHPGTRVHATAATIDGIRATAEPKRAYWTPIVGSNYPQTFAIPDVLVRDGEHLSIDGVQLIINDFGSTECSDNICDRGAPDRSGDRFRPGLQPRASLACRGAVQALVSGSA